jgi:alpha-1,3-rhamnosyltransferase
MTVSVLVLCRNYERFVEACLRSIVATNEPCELVFVDNGSKDRSVALAERVLCEAPACIKTKVISLAIEQPLCRFFNIAVAASSGDIIKPISADDMLGPNFFSAMGTALRDSDPCVGVWLAGSVIIDADGEVTRQSYEPQRFGSPSDGAPIALVERNILDRSGPAFTAPSMFYRREVYDDVGGYDERFRFEDRPFLFRVLKHGWRVVVHPYNNTFYRVHSAGISADAAWMAEARLPILYNYAKHSQWSNKPVALFQLLRGARVVAANRLRKWRAERGSR